MGKSRPEAYGLLPDGDQPATKPVKKRYDVRLLAYSSPSTILKDYRFWVLVICFSGAIMGQMMVFVHQVSYAIDNDIGRVAAASSLGAIGLASIFGRFFFWMVKRSNP